MIDNGGPDLLDSGATLGDVVAGAADDVARIAADEAAFLASQDFSGRNHFMSMKSSTSTQSISLAVVLFSSRLTCLSLD